MRQDIHRAIGPQLFCALWTVVILSGAPLLLAQATGGNAVGTRGTPTPASQEPAPLVSVRLVSVGTIAGGSTGKPSAWFGGGKGLRLGESMTGAVIAGSPGDRNLCAQWGSMGGTVDPNQQDALHLWLATIQPTKVAGDDITLVVDWKRFDAAGQGGREARAGGSQTMTLKSGERHILDFVASSAPAPSTCESVVVHVEASLVDDPPLANTTLAYDLWLVDQDPSGRQVTRHMEIAGRQRESISFRFFPIGWSADGSPAPEDRRPDMAIEVSGTLTGRLLPDGTLRIAVRPSRSVRAGDAGGSAGYAETTLSMKPGETIRMDIPPSGPGILRTHRTSLSLTVRAW